MKAAAASVETPWLWTLAFGQHEDRTPTHGYEATREAAMAAFGKELAVGVTMTKKRTKELRVYPSRHCVI